MRVFLSWSGLRSKLVAEALRDWLPFVMHNVKPWLSARDIAAGSRWSHTLSTQLNNTDVGIFCITRENMNSPWLLFEAGAISKTVDNAYVVPFLLNLYPTDLRGPLEQFQAVRADLDGARQLLSTLNSASTSEKLDTQFLDTTFRHWWPELEQRLKTIPPESEDEERGIDRSDRQLLIEVRDWVQHLVVAQVRGRGGVDLNAVDDEGRTPLIFATELGERHEFIEMLLAHGADPNIRRPDGKTALTIARELADVEAERILLSHGARE